MNTMRSGGILSAESGMGAVELRVRDLDAMARFYATTLGLTDVTSRPGARVLGEALSGKAFLSLVDDRESSVRDAREAGLFHTAFLFENPSLLAGAVARLAGTGAGQFTGVGDHLVSQAFYFDDPEGNGVELYVDRPRETWTWLNGRVHMDTLWFDPEAFLAEHLDAESAASPCGLSGGPAGLGVGHVHLQVGDVGLARRFYVDMLGFEETSVIADSAIFVSAGGYHHHMAMNTWRSAGAGRRSASLGLSNVVIEVPGRSDVEAVSARLRGAGLQVEDDGRALVVEDPWGTPVRLVPRASAGPEGGARR